MYDLLVKHHEYQGSERTVRRYIQQRKAELVEQQSVEAALPLEAVKGTAQVDFGKAPFKRNGETVDLPFLVMSFPAANTFYFQVFPSENAECLLEGMQRIFQRLQSVPKVIRFDNLSPAVRKIKPFGERELTDMFERFVLHYGFQYEFCNPGKGNEKGHVESMVKYIRNNFFLPAQSADNLADLNERCFQFAEKDRQRVHYKFGHLLSELHEETIQSHLALPPKTFYCARYLEAKADKKGMIQFETNYYSTSPKYATQRVYVEVTHDK